MDIFNNLFFNHDYELYILYFFFLYGTISYIRHRFRFNKYFKKINNSSNYVKLQEALLSSEDSIKWPFIGIMVPARNEGLVIENTLRRIDKLDYPKNRLKVFIIVDKRELKDKVEILTKDAVKRIAAEIHLKYKKEYINLIEVPEWYSGVFGSKDRTFKKSTKGRALNYALEYINKKFKKIEILGILDADGRLHPEVLKEVGLKIINDGSKLLQGPVFQISNFKSVNIVGIVAGIELAIHHMTELPAKILNNKVQFLAGTNYFVDKKVITTVKGWDQDTLVEDAELAIRIYSSLGIKAQWLNSFELEQSPKNFRIYRKQRERWARGHLHLIKYVLSSKLNFSDKLGFFVKIFSSQFRFFIDLFIPLLALYLLLSGKILNSNSLLNYLSFFFAFMSILILDLYGYMYRRLVLYMPEKPSLLFRIKMCSKLFIFMPLFMFIQAVPRMQSIFNYLFTKQQEWYKTERTKELITE